jgi:hypothetical protein
MPHSVHRHLGVKLESYDQAIKPHFEECAKDNAYFCLFDELRPLENACFDPRCVWRDQPSAVLVGRR